MSVHVHSQHKALTKYAIYKCIFPACGLLLDSLNSEFRKEVFFIVMLSNFGEGNGTPLQYSCLENPMDGGAW